MRLLLGLAFLALSGVLPVMAQAKHPISPTELMTITRVSDPQISPAGSLVAYVRSTAAGRCSGDESQIWLVPSDGSSPARPFVVGGYGNTSPEWTPGGRAIAFLSDRTLPARGHGFAFTVAGPGVPRNVAHESAASTAPASCRQSRPRQIWEISLDGGDARPLTAIAGGVSAFHWSPDGKQIAFVRRDQPDAKIVAARKKGNDEAVENKHYLFDRLWIYDLQSHQARLLTTEPGSVDNFAWSPDGTRILARISPTTLYNDRWYISKIALINVHTGAEKTLLAHAGGERVSWSPDGHKVVYSIRLPHGIAALHVVHDLASGNNLTIGAKYPATIEAMAWKPDSRSFVAAATEGTSRIFLNVNASTGAITRLGAKAGGEGFSLSKNGTKIAFVRSTPTDPGDVTVWAGGHERTLSDANPQVNNWLLPTTRPVTWNSSLDGTRICGIVLLPPGYQAGRRYPTVVWVHGGPEEAYVSDFHGSWYDWLVILASHGYVVLLPNPRGSDGQGVAFADANYQDWGGHDFHDIIDGVTMLEKEGIADPARLGIGGWSYGGFMTSWAVTHTDGFKVAVMGAGMPDLVSAATTSDIAPSYWRDYWGDLVGADAEELLYRHSPIRYLKNCHTPVLIVVGGADARLTPSQSYEFYHGLQDLGRKPVMVVYPREHHIFVERPHQINSLTRMLQWYESHLGR